MKHFFNFRKSKLLLLWILAMVAGGVSPAWAEDLTVYDGTASNAYLPVYGYYADTQGTISEFIIPNSDLTTLNTQTIEKMVFYLQSPATDSWGNASFNVYLEEVEGANYDDSSASQLTDNKTLVYAGALDGTGSTMEIPFTTNYTYNGGNLLVAIEVGTKGTYKAASFYGTTTTYNAGRYKYSSTSGRAKFIPKTTFMTPTNGPALNVKDGSTKIVSGYTYNYGLTTVGKEKEFILSNPGSESVTVNIEATNGFGVNPASTTIAAKGEATLTVTMANTTTSGVVTITPTTEVVDGYTINVSGTIRDANKIFIDFEENALPSTWTIDSHWSTTSGKASITYYTEYITSGSIKTDEGGENLIFKYARNSSSTYSTSQLTVEYATTGNGTDADWTEIEGAPAFEYNVWKDASYAIPAAAKYIRIKGCYVDIDDIYGLTEVAVPVMKVTQPASLDFGVIAENATKTFTIANDGKAALENISVSCDNSTFTISNAPASLDANGSQEVTITMSATTIGSFSGKITVSAPDQTPVEFTMTGTVLPSDLTVIDFNNNQLPNDRWTAQGDYVSFTGGAAVFDYNSNGSNAVLTTPKVQMGQYLVVKAKLDYTSSASYHLTVKGSTDNGETYTYTKRFGNDVMTTDYQYFVLSDIPAEVNRLQFVGYYATIDEIQGINYAPELAVTLEGETVASPATYDFGECSTDATVTYNFANIGDGELSITGAAITGEGADAYSTNFESAVVAPTDLVITRTYNAEKAGTAQDATITVTTTAGDFVINVSGTDRAANAPELAIDVENLDFGKLAANDTKTVTVTNAGTGSMSVNIASDSELFTVSPATLEGIAAGESKTFDVTFNYASMTENYGAQNATITVTPTYEGGVAKTIAATAIAKDPATWTEDFADANVADRGWDMATTGWSIADGKAVSTSVSGDNFLVTPYLTVTGPSDELTFDYESTANYTYIYYYIKKADDESWPSYSIVTGSWINNGVTGTFTITGLKEGTYQIRFNDGNFKLDNFEGFKRYIPKHDATVTAQTIPTSGYQNRTYTASVTVQEKAGKTEENVVAKFYIGENLLYTSEAQTLKANGTATFELTFKPEEAVSGTAKIVVGNDDVTCNSATASVTIYATVNYAETETNTIESGFKNVILNRTFINGWNTVCLPFAIGYPNSIESVFGEGVMAYGFTSYSAENGMEFTKATKKEDVWMKAATPYLLYIPETIDVSTLSEIFLTNVSVSTNEPAVSQGDVTFHGTYNKMSAGSLTGSYVLTPKAKIAKAGSGASLMGFRAYFTTTGEARMSIRFDDSTTTAIGALTTDGELELGTMYNLQGQKVQGAQKGLYIINGKKVVRK